nr:transposase [Nocardia miyunensis]
MAVSATAPGDRHRVLTGEQWELLELLLPKSEGRVSRNFANNRLVVEGMLYRLRAGLPWRDLPEHFGPWQTVWKWRAVATRYDKLALNYRAGVVLAFVIEWLRLLGDTPYLEF